jgi:hypothetical protein
VNWIGWVVVKIEPSKMLSKIFKIYEVNYHKSRMGVWKLSVFRPERKHDSGEFIPREYWIGNRQKLFDLPIPGFFGISPTPIARVKLASPMLSVGNYLKSTVLPLVKLFNF